MSRRRRRMVVVETRAQWRELLRLAQECAGESPPPPGDLRWMRLAHDVRGALTGLFMTECGYSTFEFANGFKQLAAAFAKDSTDPALKVAMAATVRAGATFLDNRLWDAGHEAFQRAHANRPEVM